ncbi:MAG: HDOD domain-containing protein [Polyangiaceae bacterium]
MNDAAILRGKGGKRLGAIADNVVEELWFGDVDDSQDEAHAAASLAARLADVQGLKPFPVVAQRVLALLNDPDFDLGQIAKLLEGDTALATKLLRVANSSLFARGNRIASIESAVVRLGGKTVMDMLLAVAAMGLFKDAWGAGLRIREHSVGVAVVARRLADLCGWSGGSQVFLAGLLHDVGKLLIMQADEYDYAPDGGVDVHLGERVALGYDHAVLGGHALRLWEVPEPLPVAIAWHHQLGRALTAGGDIGLMVAMLDLADNIEKCLAETVGCSTQDLARRSAAEYLQLTAVQLDSAWDSFREERNEALALFA